MTDQIEKIYWTTGEVADMLKIKESNVRFWCIMFGEPNKRKGNNRFFNKKEVERMQKIYQLLKVERYTIEGAKIKLK